MTVETVPINALSNDPGNVRRHTEAQIEKLMAILRRFGQQIPLVIDAQNVVRVGNARLEAARRLGWETITVTRTALSGADLVAFAIADNKSGDADTGSEFDREALAATLSALAAEDNFDPASIGFDADEFAKLVQPAELPAADDQQAPDEFTKYDDDIPTNCKCPKCGFEWAA